MSQTIELTTDSLKTFLAYADDAGNWSDEPWVSNGNIECTKEMRGNLSDLVKKGLIQILGNGKGQFIRFTAAGAELAAGHKIAVEVLA